MASKQLNAYAVLDGARTVLITSFARQHPAPQTDIPKEPPDQATFQPRQRLTFICAKSLRLFQEPKHIFQIGGFLDCSKADQRATTILSSDIAA